MASVPLSHALVVLAGSLGSALSCDLCNMVVLELSDLLCGVWLPPNKHYERIRQNLHVLSNPTLKKSHRIASTTFSCLKMNQETSPDSRIEELDSAS